MLPSVVVAVPSVVVLLRSNLAPRASRMQSNLAGAQELAIACIADAEELADAEYLAGGRPASLLAPSVSPASAAPSPSASEEGGRRRGLRAGSMVRLK